MQKKTMKNDSFTCPEKAARELVRLAKILIEKNGFPWAYTGVWNWSFVEKSSVDSYKAGRDYAVEKRWLKLDRSGTRVMILPAGEGLQFDNDNN